MRIDVADPIAVNDTPAAATGDAMPRQPASATRSVLAAVIGNALEWFDLVVYGFFAATIAGLFFPSDDPTVALLLTFGTFGSSFLIRPLGAVVIGRYADRAGRRAALVMVSSLMLLGTLIIAVLPTYASIGLAAPALLLLARLLQGFSAGGEFGSATAYLAEQSPDRRGYFASWQFASQGISTVLASAIGLALTHLLSEAQLAAWGWRIPFFIGLLIGPVAYVLRYHADETPEFLEGEAQPLTLSRGELAMRTIVGCGAVVVATVAMYFMVYLPTYASTALGLEEGIGFEATLLAGALLLVVPPIAGTVSDRVGRLPVALPVAAIFTTLPVPLFLWLVAAPSAPRVLAVEAVLGLLCAIYFGALPAYLSELFPTRFRTTGLSLAYNIAVVGAGGFAPVVFSLLVGATGAAWTPSLYICLAAAISLVALLFSLRLKDLS